MLKIAAQKNKKANKKAAEVKKLLKEIDLKKAVGVDTIPSNLIKIGADIIFLRAFNGGDRLLLSSKYFSR